MTLTLATEQNIAALEHHRTKHTDILFQNHFNILTNGGCFTAWRGPLALNTR
jgi:hypothetical protein